MAQAPGASPRKGRFTKSGHTSHGARAPQYPTHHQPAPPVYPPPLPRPRRPPSSYEGERAAQFSRPAFYGAAPQPTQSAQRPPTIGRAALTRTNQAARVVTRKVISASKADGAHESGLTVLIWNQVLSYG